MGVGKNSKVRGRKRAAKRQRRQLLGKAVVEQQMQQVRVVPVLPIVNTETAVELLTEAERYLSDAEVFVGEDGVTLDTKDSLMTLEPPPSASRRKV